MAWTYLDLFYGTFPRQISKPERITVNSMEEFQRQIHKYHNTGKIGATPLNYTKEHIPVIDKLPFDFDTPETCFEEIKKFHTHFRHIKHALVFSGGGFHAYLWTKNYEGITNPRAVGRAAYEAIENELKVKVDPSLKEYSDGHPLAIPGVSYNPKRQRFCIFVTEEDLRLGYEHIRELAKTPEHPLIIYGTDLYDISQHIARAASYVAQKSAARRGASLAEQSLVLGDEWLSKQPKFIQNILTNTSKCGRKARFYFACWCRHEGYSANQAYAIAEFFMSKLKHDEVPTMYHRIVQKDVITSVYNNPKEYTLPNEKTLKNEGIVD